ncbi:hypothetical protein ACQ4PT_018282 [Festuca glaucescens]
MVRAADASAASNSPVATLGNLLQCVEQGHLMAWMRAQAARPAAERSALNNSLLSKVNLDKETPLIVAVTGGHVTLASLLLTHCHTLRLSETILEKDKNKCNALHHAIRCGHRNLALELIAAEPALSQSVNEYEESAMFVAVMRGFTDVSEKLLTIPGSAYSGPHAYDALHAAVRNGNSGTV